VKWIETKVSFQGPDRSLATELIADAFSEVGVQGVVIEGPDAAPVEGWAPDVPPPVQKDAVIGYIPRNADADQLCHDLEIRLSFLGVSNGITTRIECRDLDEEDWAESWKAFFWPLKISRRIVVKPTWRSYHEGPGDRVIEIDPGMAFGTGTHPTTSLCVRLIETHINPGDSLLDIGTGSGILLIAAGKLGAGRALGIDNDPVAVTVANENLRRNHLDPGRFHAIAGDLAGGLSQRFHLVVANILSEVILLLLDQVAGVMAPGGLFICSGIIEKNRRAVADKMERMGFDLIEETSEEGWVALAGRLH
jgi:ribosomal protein L11 methyltransferase